MADKKKIIFLCIGIILVGLLIVGGTYAYFTFSVSITNANYVGSTTCFIIDYDAGDDITGTLFPSSTPVGGLTGNVSIGIDSSCSVLGLGNIYMNVTTVGSTLTQTVAAHCENSKTLKTMASYTTFSTCTAQINGVWVTSGTALKYAVYTDVNSDPIKVGYITGTGDIELYNDFSLSSTQTKYYIYVWLDGEISDNSYASIPFNGYIHADAIQVE